MAPAPTISTGGFFWQPADQKLFQLASGGLSSQVVTPGFPVPPNPQPIRINAPQVVGDQIPRFPDNKMPLLTKDDGNVLALLQKRAFVGNGFNTIFRPRSNTPLAPAVPGSDDNVLQLNLTQETMTFSEALGDIPNRGFSDQPDIVLKGVSYVQKVDDVANPASGKADGPPSGIHFEPGVWLAVPQVTKAPVTGPTLCRMASIPHGTTINAQGVQPAINSPLPGSQLVSSIGKVDITPFFINSRSQTVTFQSQTFSSSQDNRLPADITKFDNKEIQMRALLQDPNAFLRNGLQVQANQGISVVSFHTFKVTTTPTPTSGGGTANIAFLGGNSTSPALGGSNQNAHAVQMDTTYWIETVTANLPIKGNKPEQTFKPAGPQGPTFVVGPTTGLQDTSIPVTWTQIQYSQNVLLNFGPLSWPHVSVATLAENTVFDVRLRALA